MSRAEAQSYRSYCGCTRGHEGEAVRLAQLTARGCSCDFLRVLLQADLAEHSRLAENAPFLETQPEIGVAVRIVVEHPVTA